MMSELPFIIFSTATAIALTLISLELNKLSNEIQDLKSYKVILKPYARAWQCKVKSIPRKKTKSF